MVYVQQIESIHQKNAELSQTNRALVADRDELSRRLEMTFEMNEEFKAELNSLRQIPLSNRSISNKHVMTFGWNVILCFLKFANSKPKSKHKSQKIKNCSLSFRSFSMPVQFVSASPFPLQVSFTFICSSLFPSHRLSNDERNLSHPLMIDPPSKSSD
jgi:hypothetical protein